MTERYHISEYLNQRPSVLQELQRIEKSKEAILSLLKEREENGKNEIDPEKLVNSVVRKLHDFKFEDGYSVDGNAVKGAVWSLLADDVCHFSPMNEIILGPMSKR